jgi:hypothetical protein
MKMKTFIGATFHDDYNTRKVDDFRRRFDPKYESQKILHMSLFSPFWIEDNEFYEMTEVIEDEIDNFFFEQSNFLNLTFTGLDCHKANGSEILYLKPMMEENLTHCIESMHSIVQTFIHEPQFKTKVGKSFLPLGRFLDHHQLQTAIEFCQNELTFPLNMRVKSISIFTKRNGFWIEKERVKQFDNNINNHFLQTSSAYL